MVRSRKQIILAHTLTYFNLINLVLAGLVLLSGQYRNMLFMGIVISNSCIGIIQELKVKRLIDALSVVTATKTKRYHQGKWEEVAVEELHVGDRISLSLGDQIPVDCETVRSYGAEINESLLTGEAKPVKKEKGDFLYSGSNVVAGTIEGKVVHVGDENYAAQLVIKARTKRRATSEMQNAIKRIIKYVGYVLIPIGIVLYLIQRSTQNSISDSLVSTVAGVLGMIPEGLVLLTSISFILGVGRLARKQALVQEMEAIEALARVEVLCLDKTGTITTGLMRVKEVRSLTERYGKQSSCLGKFMSGEVFAKRIIGSMVHRFTETNATGEALRRAFSDEALTDIVDTTPFSSERKYMGMRVKEQGVVVEYRLGAPEYLTHDKDVLHQIGEVTESGIRVLLLTRDAKPIAWVSMEDEIKEDAPETLRFFRDKGVDIKIVSGDAPLTVSAVARRAGLVNAEKWIDARELPENEEELAKVVEEYTIFGRVSPEKKQAIIRALEWNDKVTGMVGDGVNDVLALKDADCGIAMASGSAAAKQTAHIVLLDSDFSSMKEIVKEGRTIIANIERVSALYLTKTMYSVLLCVLCIILGKSYPFIPIQMSLIGATAIGIPSFFLALERHEDTIPKGFLRNVLRISVPAAVILTSVLVALMFFEQWFHAGEMLVSTLNFMAGAIVSFGVLVAACTPMSRLRFVLCISVMGIFAAAVLLSPDFFCVISLKETIMWIAGIVRGG